MSAPALATGRIRHVIQGQYLVSSDAGETLTTILGSCVATCLFDPEARIGGMNHFLLADDRGSGGGDLLRYGPHAMELLINALLKAGAHRERLRGKLFGGASMQNSLRGIGPANAAFARNFLKTEGIPCLAECLGGTLGLRLRFWPTTGRVQLRTLDDPASVPAERPAPVPPSPGDDMVFF